MGARAGAGYGDPPCLPRLGAPSAQSAHGPFGSCTQIPSASRHHYPRLTPPARSAPGAAAAAGGKAPTGLLCPASPSPGNFVFVHAAPSSDTPGYLLSSCSILSDVKEDSTGSSLTCHLGLQRYSRGLAGVREDTAHLCRGLTLSPAIPS